MPTETKTSVENGVYLAFNKIQNFARDLNTQLPSPEVVIVGKQGHGKSALLEALIGQPFNLIQKEREGKGTTKRPIYLNLINNIECEEPRLTLKRDTLKKEPTADKVIGFDQIEAEIAIRNSINNIPIYITYEYKYCWNVTFIDTPGLFSEKVEHSESEIPQDEILEMITDLAKPANRIIICVEEVKDGIQSEMVPIIKKVDPKFDRTIFVYNKFSDQLRNFTSTRDLNRYLSSTATSDTQSFFTSLLSYKERSKYIGNKEKFKKKLIEQVKEDLDLLEQLQYDRRYGPFIGIVALKKQVLELTWKKYQDNIPELLKRLRTFKRKSESNLELIQAQLNSLESNTLRGNAARYAMHFLQNIEKLLTGTLEGNPSINGQTLEEEKLQDETGDWRDSDFNPIKFDPKEWKIPHPTSKLYGGQQFERLLAEFKSVAEHRTIQTPNLDDIATAAGPQKLNNYSNIAWAASDIAQKQIQKILLPLLDQLFKRAIYLMKRLVVVVDNMMENQKKNRKRSGLVNSDSFEEFDEYPFFVHAVKDLYFKFVEETAETCKKKCKDEFFSTRLIYWELTNLDSKNIPSTKGNNPEEIKKIVTKLATETFDKIKERLTKNILLKCYNFFLVPMQTEIWSELQGSITCFPDEQLQDLFEVQATTARLISNQKDMQTILSKFSEQEHLFLDYTSTFSKASPRDLDF